MSALRFTLTGVLTSYPRLIVVGLAHPKLLRHFIAWALVSVSLLSALIYLRPLPGLLVFLLPMLTSLFITVWATHSHHSGLDGDDPYAASRNILDPLYNKLLRRHAADRATGQ